MLNISIHAPREGGDVVPCVSQAFPQNFNPRPPRGGRPCNPGNRAVDVGISIHAPREGGDSKDAQFYL